MILRCNYRSKQYVLVMKCTQDDYIASMKFPLVLTLGFGGVKNTANWLKKRHREDVEQNLTHMMSFIKLKFLLEKGLVV